MSFDKLLVDRVFIIRWIIPQVSDHVALVRATEDAHARAGKMLIYVAIAPSDSPPPPEELRKLMAGNLESMLKVCDFMHLVFEGTGFSQTVKRMALASIVLVSGMKKRLSVHESVHGLITISPPDRRAELSKAFRVAIEKGFLTGVSK